MDFKGQGDLLDHVDHQGLRVAQACLYRLKKMDFC